MLRSVPPPVGRLATVIRALLAALIVAGAGAAHARFDTSEVEMKLLPRYCPDTMGFGQYGDAHTNTSPRAGYWVSLMGPSFWHMHHYCISLVLMNRALKAQLSRDQRKQLWTNALNNYLYVTERAEPEFIMLPEVYTRIGDVELLLGDIGKAQQAFARARELKPDYWPAYTHWAEFLMRNGKRSEAMQVVRAGLEHSPTAKVLLEQYRTLGGKPSELPKPVAKTAADEQPAAKAPAEASPAAGPAAAPGTDTAGAPTTTPSTAASATSASGAQADAQ